MHGPMVYKPGAYIVLDSKPILASHDGEHVIRYCSYLADQRWKSSRILHVHTTSHATSCALRLRIIAELRINADRQMTLVLWRSMCNTSERPKEYQLESTSFYRNIPLCRSLHYFCPPPPSYKLRTLIMKEPRE